MNEDFKALVEKINANRAKMNPQKAESGYTQTSKQPKTALNRGKYSELTDSEYEAHKDDIAAIEAAQDICRGCRGASCNQSEAGMVPVVAPDNGRFYTAMRMCKWEKLRRENRKKERLFSRARVPFAYSRDSFTTYKVTPDNTAAVEAAKWSLEAGNRRGLFIYGTPGTGKTKLAAVIANEKAGRGEQVLFSSVPDFLADLRASFGKNTTAEVMDLARDIPCLILDDLGAERLNDWVGEQIFSLLNHRYNEGLQTIITSNFSPERIVDRLAARDKAGNEDDTNADRIMSRIYGMCELVELGGKDWRNGGMTI